MSLSRALALAGLAAAVLAAAARRLTDPDLPWHLAVGRELLSGRWPGKDEFSYTFAGTPVPYETLADAALYAAHALAGPPGLQVLAAAALAGLAWLVARRAGAGWTAAAAAALCLGALGPFTIVRPALLGLPLWAAALLALERLRAGGGRREALALCALQLVWANTHAFAPVGAAAAALWALEECLERPQRRSFAVLTALGAAAATCVSAFGPGIFLAPLRVSPHAGLIAEWAPGTLELFTLYNPALGLLVAAAAAAALVGREEDGSPAPKLYDAGLLLGLLALSAARYRLSPLLAVAAAPWVVARLQALVPDKGRPAAAPALAWLAALALLARSEAPLGSGWDARRLPVEAAAWLEENPLKGPMWNDLSAGGYLIWRLEGRAKVFIDGRTANLYPLEFLKDARASVDDPAVFERLRARWGFEWAVVDARPGAAPALALASSPDWAMVYCDDASAIYARAGGANDAAAREGYHALRHLSPWRAMPQADLPADLLLRDAMLAYSQAPGSQRSLLWLAGAALAGGQPGPVAKVQSELKRLYPRHPDLDAIERARLRLDLGLPLAPAAGIR